MREIEIGLLEPEAGADRALVEGLTRLVNDVYAVAEEGIWRPDAERTTSRI